MFNVPGSDWIELEETYEKVGHSPVNDIAGEDCFWNVATAEMKEDRRRKISDTYNNKSAEAWQELVDHRVKGNPQSQQIELDGIVFKSKNACARYCMDKYGVSRNTALRYLAEGRHPKEGKQTNRQYKGSYKGAKYL